TRRVRAAAGGAGPGRPLNPLNAGFTVSRPDGTTPMARLGTDDEGEPAMVLSDPDGNTRLEAALAENGTPNVRLRDADGRTRLRSGVDADGFPTMNLLDENGHARVAVRTLPDGGERVS